VAVPLAAIHADVYGVLAAFAAGFVSFASPCIWPVVPAYLTYVSGVAFADLGDQTGRVTRATAAFVLGFGAVFTLVGAGVGVAGGAFLHHRRGLELVAGLVVVAMGAVLLLGGGTRLLAREHRVRLAHRPAGPIGAAVAGVAFAVGWTPCIGPTLTAILGLAASSGHAGAGAILLAAYSVGLGVPFLLTGLFFTRAMGALRPLRRHSGTAIRVAGALLVVAGVLVASGELTTLSRNLGT
jgi:cytochrome c-type biogenesis protein